MADAAPLTARSVVASTLLGVDPPMLPARLLVRSGELFGISDGTTRVAISRMTSNGELVADGDAYRLAGARMTARAVRQGLSRAGSRVAWDGSWRMAVVVADERGASDRAALRRAASRLRYAERREGVWLRPDNLPPAHDQALAEASGVLDVQCERFTATPDRPGDELAAQLFDLAAWQRRAEQIATAITTLLPRLERLDLTCLSDAFVVSAATLRHFQSDPLLPDELLPHGWPGAHLRESYERFDAAFKSTWSSWFATQPR